MADTSPHQPDGQAGDLDTLRTTPLDRITGADVTALVQRVITAHKNHDRITAAKFSSFI